MKKITIDIESYLITYCYERVVGKVDNNNIKNSCVSIILLYSNVDPEQHS